MGGRVTRLVRVVPVVLGVAFGVSLLAPATPAAAHNSLTGSDPRDGARLATAPARVELRFLAKPAPATTKITITGPDNVVAGGSTDLRRQPGTRAVQARRRGRLYIVGYQVASGDGHPIKGEVRFTLTTGTAADPSATPSAGGAAPAGSPSAGSTLGRLAPAVRSVAVVDVDGQLDGVGCAGGLGAVRLGRSLVALDTRRPGAARCPRRRPRRDVRRTARGPPPDRFDRCRALVAGGRSVRPPQSDPSDQAQPGGAQAGQGALAAEHLQRLEQRQPDRAAGDRDPDRRLGLAELEAALGADRLQRRLQRLGVPRLERLEGGDGGVQQLGRRRPSSPWPRPPRRSAARPGRGSRRSARSR